MNPALDVRAPGAAEHFRPPELPVAGRALLTLAQGLRLYHRHRLYGLPNLRRALRSHRPVILVGNHCMDVTDPAMLVAAMRQKLGRPISAIGHEMIFFRVPGVRSFVESCGVVPSRHMDLAEATLRREGALLLYPGAGSEAALRSYRREPYTLKWYGRLGFVELALATGATVLFVAGIGIDEMYYQTDLPVPRALFRLLPESYLDFYRGMRIQLGLLGVHLVPGVFPLPVRVTHVISRPLGVDLGVDPADRAAVEKQQVRLWAECQALLDDAIARRERYGDPLDQALRASMSTLRWLGV